jgi:hypothetical protein
MTAAYGKALDDFDNERASIVPGDDALANEKVDQSID